MLRYQDPGDGGRMMLVVRQDTELMTRWHEEPFYSDLLARTARYRVIIAYGDHSFELTEAAPAPPAEPVEGAKTPPAIS